MLVFIISFLLGISSYDMLVKKAEIHLSGSSANCTLMIENTSKNKNLELYTGEFNYYEARKADIIFGQGAMPDTNQIIIITKEDLERTKKAAMGNPADMFMYSSCNCRCSYEVIDQNQKKEILITIPKPNDRFLKEESVICVAIRYRYKEENRPLKAIAAQGAIKQEEKEMYNTNEMFPRLIKICSPFVIKK